MAEREPRIPAHAELVFCDQSIERTNSWHNAHKKLAWCTERREEVIDFFWVAFSDVVIIVRRLVSGKAGSATAGKPDLPVGHDLLTEALIHCVESY